MNYRKIFRPYNGQQKPCAQISSNSYDCSLQHINNMANELRKDFNISDNLIHVQKYGGKSKKGITFVEVFLPNETQIPIGYTEVVDIEDIL